MSFTKVLTTKITSTISQGSRMVQVGYVETTDMWTRTLFDSSVESQFKSAAQQHVDSYRAETASVALQETPHKSKSDNRTHFTAMELDAAGKAVAKRHLPIA